MELFHTSPAKIDKINSNGRFGEFLFFSLKEYVMAASEFVTYKIELADDEFIEATQIFYHEDAVKLDALVAKFSQRFEVETDEAEEIIAERAQLNSSDADDLWDVQMYTAKAAKLLGFRAVRVTDEQGSAYMIDMQGHESELTLV